jgi:hypothetical protein
MGQVNEGEEVGDFSARWLVKNLSALSTSAPTPSIRIRSRPVPAGHLDEAAGGCGGRGGLYKYYGMGIQWLFRHFIASDLPECLVETKLFGTAAYYHPAQKKSCIRAKQAKQLLSNTR